MGEFKQTALDKKEEEGVGRACFSIVVVGLAWRQSRLGLGFRV